MKALVTGSSGHFGEALAHTLQNRGDDVIGLDIREGPFTTVVGSITDRSLVQRVMEGVEVVFHAGALHKPHVATHSRQAFVDVNISGTLTLLEEAVASGVEAFVCTSSTSVFGDALIPPAGAPAAWITEDVTPIPKNIYGVTKAAAEDLCQLFHRNEGLACVVLRTSRFFPEDDDDPTMRAAFGDANHKVNEFLSRRVEIDDVVSAHLLAAARAAARTAERAPTLGFGRYIISAATPFAPEDMAELRVDAPAVVRRLVPAFEDVYARLGWTMAPRLDRVYVSARAWNELGWRPRFDFPFLIERLAAGENVRSRLAGLVGSKGYHTGTFADGPYPVDDTSRT